MGVTVSPTFAAQAAADANILRTRAFLNFGDYGLTPATWTSAPTAFSDQSVYDSSKYAALDLGEGIRTHRNFGGAEGGTDGRGWLGANQSDSSGAYTGLLIRNLESTNDGNKTNGPPPGTGKKLAQRAQAPTPGGGVLLVTLQQFAVRIAPVGAPGAVLVRIYSDVAGAPGAVLLTVAVNPSDSVNGWAYIETGGPLTFAVGAFYWIVMDAQTVSAVNNWTWAFVGSSTVGEYASENATGPWVAQTYRLHYRTTFSWAAGPTIGEYVTVSFGTRKVNRVRIYSYPSTRTVTGKGVATIQIQTGAASVFSAVSIQTVKASDYGNAAPVVAIGAGQVSSGTATFFDVLFDAVSADALRLIITKTQTVFDFSRLVAVEVFYEQQIGPDRVIGAQIQGRRDQFWKSDQAGLLDLELSNTDRFFSPLYLPLAAQVAAGYLNAELRPNLWLRVEQAFQTDEWVPLGEFYVDSLSIAPRGRTAHLQARDFNKFLMKSTLAETARLRNRVEDLLEVTANRANFSSSRMVLAETETAVPVWFPQGIKARDEMDKVAEAAPLSLFRFDEFGMLRTETFLPSTFTLGNVPPSARKSVV